MPRAIEGGPCVLCGSQNSLFLANKTRIYFEKELTAGGLILLACVCVFEPLRTSSPFRPSWLVGSIWHPYQLLHTEKLVVSPIPLPSGFPPEGSATQKGVWFIDLQDACGSAALLAGGAPVGSLPVLRL